MRYGKMTFLATLLTASTLADTWTPAPTPPAGAITGIITVSVFQWQVGPPLKARVDGQATATVSQGFPDPNGVNVLLAVSIFDSAFPPGQDHYTAETSTTRVLPGQTKVIPAPENVLSTAWILPTSKNTTRGAVSLVYYEDPHTLLPLALNNGYGGTGGSGTGGSGTGGSGGGPEQ